MNRILGTYENGRVIVDAPAAWPDGSRVEISLVSPASQSGKGQDEAPPGVREVFLDAMKDENRFGLEESLWPQTLEERDIWLKWFDSRQRLDLSDEEIDKMEAMWKESKGLQKEMVRESWEKDEPLFE